MGERKVLSKYYPPDFDPSKLPRVQKKRQNDDAVRFMLPMSVRCESCGEFMGVGLKFNARKADTGDTYLGIRIFRFTMRCKGCPAPFAIRTDPKNGDYECESGVRRNFEPWRKAEKEQTEAKKEREKQDEDAVQALENRTMDAKAQMDDLDDLHSILTENAKRAKLGVDHLIKSREKNIQTEDEILTAEADLLLSEARRGVAQGASSGKDRSPPSENDRILKTKKASSNSALFNGAIMKVKVKKKTSITQRKSTAGPEKPTQGPQADNKPPVSALVTGEKEAEKPPSGSNERTTPNLVVREKNGPPSTLMGYSSSSSSSSGEED